MKDIAKKYEKKHVIECHNVPDIDMNKQDGGLPHMAGVYTYQVRRSCRADGDYTYNHAPMLTGFNGRLLLSYISGKKDEHGAPDEVVYTTSKDGMIWEKERVMFPYMLADSSGYIGPDKELLPEHAKMIVHSRMCFYQASDGRMLATTFYGFSPDFHRAPNNGFGIARLVREVYSDFTLSDMFIIKYNTAGGFTKENTHFYRPEDDRAVNIPYYDESEDSGFIKACRELLSDKLVLEQWYEEEMYDKQHYIHRRALSFYTAKDGSVVGLCKKGEGYIALPFPVTVTLDHDYDEEEKESESVAPMGKGGAADEELFSMLKDLRKKVAKQHGLPPFVIFQDPSLEDMAVQYPITFEEMQNITGVGVGKARKFGEEFIRLIKAYVDEKEIIRPQDMIVKGVASKSGNKIFIIQSIDRKMDFEDIARAKDLDFDELLTEIEGIVNAGTKLDISYYLKEFMDEDKIEDIYLYFKEDAESDSLDAAIEELGADYTEEEIRLVRIKFMCEQGN